MQEAKRLRDAGKLPKEPTKEQLIDFAYGNTKIENPKMTREIATRAVTKLLEDQGK
jgi:hypothetical protein